MLKVIPMKTKKAIAGFTLIELIIVLAIIAVLAAVAVPGIGGYIRDNRIEEANNNAQILARGAQTWLNEMEADNKPIDAYNNPVGTSEANLFKTTFANSSYITLASNGTYEFNSAADFPSPSTPSGKWLKLDKSDVTNVPDKFKQVNLTKYLSGLKPAKSGTDLGSCFICIDLNTKTVKYAAWSSDVDLTVTSYLGSNGGTHAIDDLNDQETLVTSNGNKIIGVYPMNGEL